MATAKVTFTLDAKTLSRLADAAARLHKPKSAIVREAIQDYHDRIGRLSEAERIRLLKVFDTLLPRVPSKPLEAVQAELRAIRAARRAGGRGAGS